MAPLDLPPGVALRFAAPAARGAEPLDALTPEERARAASFALADRRLGFALGRTAARGLLAERLGCAPQAVPLTLADGGAPVVAGHPLFVSISHAGRGAETLAAAAVAERPVGLDLEWIRPLRPDLYRRILAPDEYGLLEKLPLGHDEAQALLWSLKEAVLKGLQTGFRRAAPSVHLADVGGGRAWADAGGGSAWALRYGRHGGFWVAVALADPPVSLGPL
jgi:4'-phosphopantetheinyl transferase